MHEVWVVDDMWGRHPTEPDYLCLQAVLRDVGVDRIVLLDSPERLADKLHAIAIEDEDESSLPSMVILDDVFEGSGRQARWMLDMLQACRTGTQPEGLNVRFTTGELRALAMALRAASFVVLTGHKDMREMIDNWTYHALGHAGVYAKHLVCMDPQEGGGAEVPFRTFLVRALAQAAEWQDVVDLNREHELWMGKSTYEVRGGRKLLLDDEMFDPFVRAARTDEPVFLWGEPGTGKTESAELIHALSKRRSAPFLKFACLSRAEGNLEEIAFWGLGRRVSGADKPGPGVVENVGEGTLFLDEFIPNVDTTRQGDFTAILDPQPSKRTFRRYGAHEERLFRGRIVASGLKDPAKLVEEGTLTTALYRRVCHQTIHLPSVREMSPKRRIRLLEFLAYHHLESTQAGTPRILPRVVVDRIARPDVAFPGNIETLKNVIKDVYARVEWRTWVGEVAGPCHGRSPSADTIRVQLEAVDHVCSQFVSLDDRSRPHWAESALGNAKVRRDRIERYAADHGLDRAALCDLFLLRVFTLWAGASRDEMLRGIAATLQATDVTDLDVRLASPDTSVLNRELGRCSSCLKGWKPRELTNLIRQARDASLGPLDSLPGAMPNGNAVRFDPGIVRFLEDWRDAHRDRLDFLTFSLVATAFLTAPT